MRASSRIWASEASLARTLARSREARFASPNRRACSQATRDKVNCPYKSGVLIKRVSVKRSFTVFASCTVTASCPPYRMSATRGSSHSHIVSYSSPTVMYRCLAINAIAASHGFSTRLSRKRISCWAKPSFSASCFHSCPPTKRNNTIFFKGICDHLDSIFSLQANSECTVSNQQTDPSFFLSALILKIK